MEDLDLIIPDLPQNKARGVNKKFQESYHYSIVKRDNTPIKPMVDNLHGFHIYPRYKLGMNL